MRRVLDRYLFWECVPTLALSVVVSSFVMMMHRLLMLSDMVAAKGVPLLEVLREAAAGGNAGAGQVPLGSLGRGVVRLDQVQFAVARGLHGGGQEPDAGVEVEHGFSARSREVGNDRKQRCAEQDEDQQQGAKQRHGA